MAEIPVSYPQYAAPRYAAQAHSATEAHLGGLAYGLLYVPSVLAWMLAGTPVLSYFAAWAGSWWILWASMSGYVKPLPPGGVRGQIMRPLVFTQSVFAGYMALTSIFFALDLLGIRPTVTLGTASGVSFALVAEAQRLYLLGHAAMVTGVLLLMDYRQNNTWRVVFRGSLTHTLIVVTVVASISATIFLNIPGLNQLRVRMITVSLVASVLALVAALPERKPGAIVVSGGLYALNMLQALLSGWKEEVLVLLLLLQVFAYPYYRRTVLFATPIILVLFLLVVPTYNTSFRSLNWQGDVGARQAAVLSVGAVASSDLSELWASTWEFMTTRLSEINLFTIYLTNTPSELPFFGTDLAVESFKLVTPRILWPSKPDVELATMQRVYANGITTPDANVSAKPQFVVDGYLSFGAVGVWLACLCYGLAAAWASRLAERWFGGYLIGSALIYTSLFQILWRGNSFEFVVAAVAWAFVVMWALFMLGRVTGRIVRAGQAA